MAGGMRTLSICGLTAALLVFGATAALSTTAGPAHSADAGAPAWDPQAAARYLDGREVAWQAWDRPQKDRGTLCISCHTQATYALARPILRQQLGEAAEPAAEQVMLSSIDKRVRLWSAMQPFYSDISSGPGKEVEAHNAEAVLNAVILSSYDQRQGHLADVSRTAFANAWALQLRDGPAAGAWIWQNFGLAPWESDESQFHWAALMAMAVGKAPDDYRDAAAIGPNLAALTGYLRSHYEGQVLLNKVVALWAAKWFPSVLPADARPRLVATLLGLQRDDGGWSLTDLGPWTRRDQSAPKMTSDGYATAIVVLVLEETGAIPRGDPHLARGLAWLAANQDRVTGAWTAWSVNKDRDPTSMEGHFMTDAATAYAVLALEAATTPDSR